MANEIMSTGSSSNDEFLSNQLMKKDVPQTGISKEKGKELSTGITSVKAKYDDEYVLLKYEQIDQEIKLSYKEYKNAVEKYYKKYPNRTWFSINKNYKNEIELAKDNTLGIANDFVLNVDGIDIEVKFTKNSKYPIFYDPEKPTEALFNIKPSDLKILSMYDSIMFRKSLSEYKEKNDINKTKSWSEMSGWERFGIIIAIPIIFVLLPLIILALIFGGSSK